jgi:hypothetical protein
MKPPTVCGFRGCDFDGAGRFIGGEELNGYVTGEDIIECILKGGDDEDGSWLWQFPALLVLKGVSSDNISI